MIKCPKCDSTDLARDKHGAKWTDAEISLEIYCRTCYNWFISKYKLASMEVQDAKG
jgi:hypothetical protein